ncbi:putative T6SS immunity periplasmic lipoprotein [Cedecea lapagei]|uniref:putative T6SS immunity periplasmic lipoprotein n=1 Tax=Cedecea lapagei TaxID=158823 RepID=UPI001BD15504|nr:putative T6SS immunity periplasmic lipoprotein [Cedecea lapagei]
MKNILLLLVLLISGCVGDRLEFRNAGTVYQKNSDVICIKSKEGDVITWYLLTSSEDTYRQSLFFADYVQKKYPDHCFNLMLKKDVTYNLLYEMNNVKYRVNFALDGGGGIKQGGIICD